MYYDGMEVNNEEDIVFSGNKRKVIATIARSEHLELADEIVRRWNVCNIMPQEWNKFMRDLGVGLDWDKANIIGEALFEKLRNGNEQ